MTQINLKKLIAKKDQAAWLARVASALDAPFGIQDADGAWLYGARAGATRFPVALKGELIGWVVGGNQAAFIADLLAHLADRETLKKTLADEILELYREINLLYHLAEKLSAATTVDAVARITLEQASSLIAASDGALALQSDALRALETAAAFGARLPARFDAIAEIARAVAQTGKAEIVNDAPADARVARQDALASLVCAPLTAKNQVIGVIVLASATPVHYNASDLKLLNAVAAQSSPAIENALVYEKAQREAQAREERLQKQIMELRIELDHARQAQKVAEITESDYFQRLRGQADTLRKIMDGDA